MRSSVVVAMLTVGLMGAVTACTGSATSGRSVEAGRSTAPTTAPTDPADPAASGPAGVISNVAALQTVTSYSKASVAAAKRRSATAAKAIQTGPQLAISLADYRYTKVAHKKPISAIALSGPGTVIPAVPAGRKWFIATEYSNREEANYVSVFEQGSGSRWRKSLEVWLGNDSFPDPTQTASGVAVLPDAAGVARDTAALTALSTYLAKGKRSAHLRSAGDAAYVRKFLVSVTKPRPGGTTTLTCAPTPGTMSAVATASGTAVVAAVSCTVAKHAKPGWRISLEGRYRALASHGTNLHGFSARFVGEVALTVTRTGDIRVIGDTWASVAVTTS